MKKSLSSVKIICLTSILLIIILFVISGCSKTNTPATNTNELISYSEYEKLFETIVNKIDINAFEVKANTLGDNASKVGMEVTFGKREYLTKSGNLNTNNIEPTEEHIVLENKNQSNQITIGVFYNENYIGNDLLGWTNNYGFNDLNEKLVQNANFAVLSYKNLIILIHQNATDKAEINITRDALKNIIKILQEYES